MRAFRIDNTVIRDNKPCYIIFEVSCNHEGDIEEAKAIIKAASEAGANAATFQTYTPNTITRNFKSKPKGTIWKDTNLHSLYSKSYPPWEGYDELLNTAQEYGLDLFLSPFDETAVDFLVEKDVPVLKVASFEIVDTKLLQKIARTGKPVIVSTGMTTYLEIQEAIRTLEDNGANHIAILHCNSGYPAAFNECNLKTIPALSFLFDRVVGLSDHTIFADEQNFPTLFLILRPMNRDRSREMQKNNSGRFDWAFLRNPDEFAHMINVIRAYEDDQTFKYNPTSEQNAAKASLGQVNFTPTPKEVASRELRPTLWATEDIKQGQAFAFAEGHAGNFVSIRPGGGLHIRYTDLINQGHAKCDILAGTPLDWSIIALDSTNK